MHYVYKTQGTCARQIEFDIDGKIVTNVKFFGGCPAISRRYPFWWTA